MTSPNLEPSAQESQAPQLEIVMNPEAQAGPKVEQFISAEDALKVLKGEHGKVANEIEQNPLSKLPESKSATQLAEGRLEAATKSAEQKISAVQSIAPVAEAAPQAVMHTVEAVPPTAPAAEIKTMVSAAPTESPAEQPPVAVKRESLRQAFSMTAAEAAPKTESAATLVVGSEVLTVPVAAVEAVPPTALSGEIKTMVGVPPTALPGEQPPVAAERHSLRQAFSVAPAEASPMSATLVSGTTAEKTIGVSPMAESVRVAAPSPEASATIAEAAPVPPAETPLEAANTIPEAVATLRSAGVAEKAPVSAEPITLAATPEAKSVSMEAVATIKEAASPVMVENAGVEPATIKEPETLKVEAVPATKGGTLRMGQQPAVGDGAVTARMAEVAPATKGGTLRMAEAVPGTKGGTLRMAEVKTPEAAMAVAGAVAAAAAAVEVAGTTAEAPIELAVTPEQLAAEKAQVSLENKFNVIDKLKPDEWNEAYTGYGVDWKKEQWDALSSDKKPGAFASEKEMFKQLRMNAMGNQFKFDQLNADLKGLGEKIRIAEAAGGATELQQLKQQESDLLLQLRKVEELKNQNETAERALQALVVERIAKSKAESSGLSVEDAVEAAAFAAAAKANQAQNQPAAQSAANVNIPTAAPKKGMGAMAVTGAGIAGLAVGLGFWAAKGIGGFLKGIGWIVDSFAKSKTFGDALTHMWDKATKKLDEAYNKKREEHK